jgi:hypothetical protein
LQADESGEKMTQDPPPEVVVVERSDILGADDLTPAETRVWNASLNGRFQDFSGGQAALDDPRNGATWGPERTVRAQFLRQLLTVPLSANSPPLRGVYVRGARISGELDLRSATLLGALSLRACYLEEPLTLSDASAIAVLLGGSYVPKLDGRHLSCRGDVRLNAGFSSHEGVELMGARIGGRLDLIGAHLWTPSASAAPALDAQGLVVSEGLYFGGTFDAQGEVNLVGADIGGLLACSGGRFHNTEGPAVVADGLTVKGGMYFGRGVVVDGGLRLPGAKVFGQVRWLGGTFTGTKRPAINADGIGVSGGVLFGEDFTCNGELRLVGAEIGGALTFKGSVLVNDIGPAFSGDALTVSGSLYMGERGRGDEVVRSRLTADGEVRLPGAHVRGAMDLGLAKLSNPGARAFTGDGMTVAGDAFLGDEFKAQGEVGLAGALIGGRFDCGGGRFLNPGRCALDLRRATVSGELDMRPAVMSGTLDLTDARTADYRDAEDAWPDKLRLEGFTYGGFTGDTVSPKQRCAWLNLNELGFAPQLYEQLASVYYFAGRDDHARVIAIAKQRRRRRELGWPGKLSNDVLRFLVGYGYRTGRAGAWLLALYLTGFLLFHRVREVGLLTPAHKDAAEQPELHASAYALDLVLPFLNLHQREAWNGKGLLVEALIVAFSAAGWVLSTAVVLSLTGILRREPFSGRGASAGRGS